MKKAKTVQHYREKLVYIEDAIVYELQTWGRVHYETMRFRHYLLKRLLSLQMKEFNTSM